MMFGTAPKDRAGIGFDFKNNLEMKIRDKDSTGTRR